MEEQKEPKRYDNTCPYCGGDIYAFKSLGMEIGWLTTGSGTCPRCEKVVELTYDREADTLTVHRGERSDAVNARIEARRREREANEGSIREAASSEVHPLR